MGGEGQQETRPVIEFRGLNHRFHSGESALEVLTQLDLQVAEGDFLAIVGPSGCGKTTLLNIGVGLMRATEGEVYLRGQPVTRTSKEIGYVTQHDSLFPWRTASDNIAFPLEIERQISKDEREALVGKWLARVNLSAEFGSLYPHQLSGGMRQRINIARSLVYDPSVVFMDEPFGPLDALTRGNLQNFVRTLWRDTKKTIVFVTHDLIEAVTLGTRVAVMSGRPGSIVDLFEVDLPSERDAFSIPNHPNFGKAYNLVKESLFNSMPATANSR